MGPLEKPAVEALEVIGSAREINLSAPDSNINRITDSLMSSDSFTIELTSGAQVTLTTAPDAQRLRHLIRSENAGGVEIIQYVSFKKNPMDPNGIVEEAVSDHIRDKPLVFTDAYTGFQFISEAAAAVQELTRFSLPTRRTRNAYEHFRSLLEKVDLQSIGLESETKLTPKNLRYAAKEILKKKSYGTSTRSMDLEYPNFPDRSFAQIHTHPVLTVRDGELVTTFSPREALFLTNSSNPSQIMSALEGLSSLDPYGTVLNLVLAPREMAGSLEKLDAISFIRKHCGYVFPSHSDIELLGTHGALVTTENGAEIQIAKINHAYGYTYYMRDQETQDFTIAMRIGDTMIIDTYLRSDYPHGFIDFPLPPSMEPVMFSLK